MHEVRRDPMIAGKTILIVEDNTLTGELIQSALASRGANVTLCQESACFYEKLKAQNFDVLITDYKLPDLQGGEIVKVARDSSTNLFIIGISIEDWRKQKLMEAGADVFLTKPFDLTSLIAVIERHFLSIAK